MKIISCRFIFLLYGSLLFAKNTDPFTPHPKHTSVMLKYQYLGYIKGPNISWAFIRPVGGDILKVVLGKNLGVGKVISFTKDNICINHGKQKYCLKRSVKALNWVAVA
jgi:hypothetical protein